MSLFSVPDIAAEAITGHYHVHGDVANADCVIGLSFGQRGHRYNIEPGLSNQDLAEFAKQHFADLPKTLQFEIADAYAEIGGVDEVERISEHRKPGKYLDTREVVDQAKLIMDRHGWKTVVVLAHPMHLPRVDAVCRKLGMQTVAVPGLNGAIEFDPLSTQSWTRNADKFRGYEPLALVLYGLKGWV